MGVRLSSFPNPTLHSLISSLRPNRRVGERGQMQDKGSFSPAAAIAAFKKQFKAKTGFDWEKRKGMVAASSMFSYP